MTGINELLGSAYSVAIAGHIGPDGDCEIGRASCRERV